MKGTTVAKATLGLLLLSAGMLAAGAGLAAVRQATGERVWNFTPPPPSGGGRGAQLGAAPTLISGVVFEGASDGVLYALAVTDGKLLWQFNTAQEFKTVHGVVAKGGSMGSGGVVVSNGMVFLASGYVGFQNGAPGNVLLAFGPAQ